MRAIKAKVAGTKPAKRRSKKDLAARPRRKATTRAQAGQKNESLADLWAIFDAIRASIPAEELRKIPKDLSYNLDHYLYGAPKR